MSNLSILTLMMKFQKSKKKLKSPMTTTSQSWKLQLVKTIRIHSVSASLIQIKDLRQLSWMSHGVMRFWFLLNFLFASVAFDIPASLSVSRVFSSGFLGRWKSPCLDIPEQLSNSLYKLNLMCDEVSYQIINTSAVNQAVFCYY